MLLEKGGNLSNAVIKQKKVVVIDEDLERLAYAATRVLAKEALYNNLEEALESLKRLWQDGVLQEYVDKIPELKKLIELGKLP